MPEPQLLSARLRAETAASHERMHGLMEQAEPFASRTRYAGFVAAQFLFQQDIERLWAEPALRDALPRLEHGGRGAACAADLRDLGAETPRKQDFYADAPVSLPAALGWLYVSEGSTLGAAFLLKEVTQRLGLDEQFGARNLAAAPEGRAPAWRRFVAALDAVPLDAAGQDAAAAGALAAFHRFGDLLARQFALDAHA